MMVVHLAVRVTKIGPLKGMEKDCDFRIGLFPGWTISSVMVLSALCSFSCSRSLAIRCRHKETLEDLVSYPDNICTQISALLTTGLQSR